MNVPNIQLEYLTDREVDNEFGTLYWKRDENGKFEHTASALAAMYQIKTSDVAKIAASVSRVKLLDCICAECGTPFLAFNRTEYQTYSRYTSGGHRCSDCIAEEKERKEAEAEALSQKRRILLTQIFGGEAEGAPAISEMSLASAIYLLAFIRTFSNEELIDFSPKGSSRLSPSTELDSEIVKHLRGQELIRVSPRSSVESFIWDGDNPSSYYTFEVLYQLSTGSNTNLTRTFISELEASIRHTKLWIAGWQDEVLPLWHKIALHECLRYLEVVLGEHGFNFRAGEKTHLVLENALKEYSVGQIYNIIWRAGRDAAAYYLREKCPRAQAANSVVGNIQRQLERAKAEGWEVKPFARDRRCPESTIYHVFFRFAIEVGDDGFQNIPTSLWDDTL